MANGFVLDLKHNSNHLYLAINVSSFKPGLLSDTPKLTKARAMKHTANIAISSTALVTVKYEASEANLIGLYRICITTWEAKSWSQWLLIAINTLKARQNGRHYAGTVYKLIFLYVIDFAQRSKLQQTSIFKIMAWRRISGLWPRSLNNLPSRFTFFSSGRSMATKYSPLCRIRALKNVKM